jgi:hypothetical protein
LPAATGHHGILTCAHASAHVGGIVSSSARDVLGNALTDATMVATSACINSKDCEWNLHVLLKPEALYETALVATVHQAATSFSASVHLCCGP